MEFQDVYDELLWEDNEILDALSLHFLGREFVDKYDLEEITNYIVSGGYYVEDAIDHALECQAEKLKEIYG